MHFKTLLAPWFRVTVGVVLTIASAVVTHFVIIQNEKEIARIDTQVQMVDQSITSYWENASRFERDSNIAMVMSLLFREQQADSVSKDYLRNYINHLLVQWRDKEERKEIIMQFNEALNKDPKHLFPLLLNIVDLDRNTVVDIINDRFLEKIQYEDQIRAIKSDNALFANIALFLQIFGLILVLTRDIGKKA